MSTTEENNELFDKIIIQLSPLYIRIYDVKPVAISLFIHFQLTLG